MRHIIRTLIPAHSFLALIVTTSLGCQVSSSLVIPAEQAAVRTEGGPVEGGWNLWSDGRVGQRVEDLPDRAYTVVIRAWGSPVEGTSGRRWLCWSMNSRSRPCPSIATRRPIIASRSSSRRESTRWPLAFLNDARVGTEDRNLYLERITIVRAAGAAAPVPLVGKSDPEAAARLEREIVAATGPAIERNRKSDAVVRVVDSAGQPIAGARVKVVQTGHEFLFGCNIYGFDHSRTEAQNAAYKTAVRRAVQLRHRRLLLAMVRNPSAGSPNTQTPTRSSPGAPSTASA